MTSFCTHCGNNIAVTANFCQRCGTAAYDFDGEPTSQTTTPLPQSNGVPGTLAPRPAPQRDGALYTAEGTVSLIVVIIEVALILAFFISIRNHGYTPHEFVNPGNETVVMVLLVVYLLCIPVAFILSILAMVGSLRSLLPLRLLSGGQALAIGAAAAISKSENMPFDWTDIATWVVLGGWCYYLNSRGEES